MLTAPGWGGTTVSATMIAAHLAGIEVFATGGIGGVHRGGEASMDISADLDELARTPVTVVCAGPKSILDVGRTLEALETRGVPVVGWQSDEVAGFYSRSSGHRAPSRVDSAEQAARLIAIQRPSRSGHGHPRHACRCRRTSRCRTDEVAAAVEQAEAEATAAGIHGPASTPFVLGRVAAAHGRPQRPGQPRAHRAGCRRGRPDRRGPGRAGPGGTSDAGRTTHGGPATSVPDHSPARHRSFIASRRTRDYRQRC